MLRQRLEARQVISAGDAAACGVDRHGLARLIRDGELLRVRRGAYVCAPVWQAATPEARHLLRCRAAIRTHQDVALSHTSAVVAAGLPTHEVDLAIVHLSRIAQPGRRGRQGGTYVHPMLPVRATTTAGDLPACTAAVAVLQLADWHGIEAGMVATEAGLHRGVFTTDELRVARGLVRLGRGRPAADLVMRFAGPHSESPGETLTRLLLHALDLPAPRQQARITLPDGSIARVDFLLPDWGVVIEFDGAVKYEGASGRAELVREKRREDGIRATGHEVVRLTWPDLAHATRVHALVLDARRRAGADRGRVALNADD